MTVSRKSPSACKLGLSEILLTGQAPTNNIRFFEKHHRATVFIASNNNGNIRMSLREVLNKYSALKPIKIVVKSKLKSSHHG